MKYRFNEDKILNEISRYIASTYKAHYVNEKAGTKDEEIQKNFADRYGIDMKEIFDEYYKADPNAPADGGEPEGEGKPEANDDDLLS